MDQLLSCHAHTDIWERNILPIFCIDQRIYVNKLIRLQRQDMMTL